MYTIPGVGVDFRFFLVDDFASVRIIGAVAVEGPASGSKMSDASSSIGRLSVEAMMYMVYRSEIFPVGPRLKERERNQISSGREGCCDVTTRLTQLDPYPAFAFPHTTNETTDSRDEK